MTRRMKRIQIVQQDGVNVARIPALVIRCTKKSFEEEKILSYLRIKTTLAFMDGVILAVEDAGVYTFYSLRTLYYFANVRNQFSDKPFTLMWDTAPESLGVENIPEQEKEKISKFLNSPEGLDRGFTQTHIYVGAQAANKYCKKIFHNPADIKISASKFKPTKRVPLLNQATLNEMEAEYKSRGYHVVASPTQAVAETADSKRKRKDIRYACQCMDCKHYWVSQFGNMPYKCPRCKSFMLELSATRI